MVWLSHFFVNISTIDTQFVTWARQNVSASEITTRRRILGMRNAPTREGIPRVAGCELIKACIVELIAKTWRNYFFSVSELHVLRDQTDEE